MCVSFVVWELLCNSSGLQRECQQTRPECQVDDGAFLAGLLHSLTSSTHSFDTLSHLLGIDS